MKKEDEPLFRLRLDATCDLFPSPQGYRALDPSRCARSIDELVSLGLIPAAYPAQKVLRQLQDGVDEHLFVTGLLEMQQHAVYTRPLLALFPSGNFAPPYSS